MTKTASGLSTRSLARKAEVVSPIEKWETKGRRIWDTVNRSAWELGDWWNAGEPYGERIEIARRIGWADNTCHNAGAVSRAFNVPRRRGTISWSHHAEVAALPEAEQEAWLDKAQANEWSRKTLRAELAAARGPKAPPALPAGTFDVLLADPPWRYDFAETDNRKVENQYPTMEADEIAALEPPSAPNAVLYLWATAPKLREALQVIEGWGFNYVTNLVWVKDKIGMGYWARGRHELLLVATKGQPGAPDPGDRPDSVIEAPRTDHSAKPDIVYDLIETAMPDRSYLELFARSGREGWTSWGNEVT
jgi:N6-adenosine-specific RNA methylase IME4